MNETAEIRWNYGDAQLGACKETIEGGDHFRYWPQNGPQGNRYGLGIICLQEINFVCFTSGAIFMAVSYELPLTGKFADRHG